MKFRIRFLFVITSLLVAGSARGEEKMSLTLDQAIQIGLEKSKSIHASLMSVQYADSRSSEANALMLPSVKFSGAYARLSDIPPTQVSLYPLIPDPITLSPSVVNNYNLKVTVQQPIFTGFKLQRNADIAEYNASSAQKDFEKDKSDLIYNIKNAYWNLTQAIELQKVVDENVEQMEAHLKDVQSWQGQGMITVNDVLKVQVQLSDAELRQIDMKNNVQLAKISFNSLLGLPLDTAVDPVTNIKHEPKSFGDLTTLVQQAMDRRPELKSMEYKVKAGNAAVAIAQSNWFPQVYFTGNYYSSRPNQRFFPAEDVFKDTWDVGIGVSFDIWNWGTTVHQTDQAKAQLSQAEDGLAQLKDGVTLDVTRNYLNLHRAQERIIVAEKEVSQAEENYRVTDAKFKQGLALNTDLLDAEVALLQAKTNYTQSLVDYEVAEAGLERAIGE
ncbi:MAG TPA: TolC family protein [Bacteroidota bacterium]|nr:TolC family protein [Bacteroidota bacterium]